MADRCDAIAPRCESVYANIFLTKGIIAIGRHYRRRPFENYSIIYGRFTVIFRTLRPAFDLFEMLIFA